MKLLFLPKYYKEGPNSRHRFFYVADQLRALGHEVEISPFLHQGYVAEFFLRGRRWSLSVLRDYWLRCLSICRAQGKRPQLTVVEYEAFPYFPMLVEKYFLEKLAPWVIDVDDAVEVRYQHIPWLRSKMGSLFSSAYGVITGNPVLAEKVGYYNRRVLCIPTGVAKNRYEPKKLHDYSVKDRSFVIGWIGSPTSYKYLEMLREPLRRVAANHSLVLRLVGPEDLPDWRGLPVEFVRWREEEEKHWLSSFDIGVMPLMNDPFARGKSGFKLIQYMAAGVPCVASDVGSNGFILDNGRAGRVVKSEREWVDALSSLISSEGLRRTLGTSGHRRFLQEFTLESLTEKRLAFYSEIIENMPSGR